MNPFNSIPTNFSHNKTKNRTQNSHPQYNQNLPQNQQQGYGYPYNNNKMGFNNSQPHNNGMGYNPYNNGMGYNPYNNGMGYNNSQPYNNGMGFNNPYQHYQQNPNSNSYNNNMQQNYSQNQMMNNQISFAMRLIDNYADSIFLKHDNNRSGFLDVNEIYPAVCDVFQVSGKPAPNYQQVIQIMRNFDQDGNGLIDMQEFREILKKALYL